MKYITKKIYDLMGKSDLHLLLKNLNEASVYSEELFKKLYKKEEAKWLNLNRQMSKVKFEEIYPEYIDFDPNSGLTENEIKDLKEEYLLEREVALKEYVPYVFNKKEELKNFKNSHRYMIKDLKRKLPKYILDEVADIRVLALNYASKDIKKAIKKYCDAQSRIVGEAFSDYYRHFEMISNKGIEVFNGSLHDSIVTEYISNENEFTIKINSKGSFSSVTNLIFKDYKIIKMESDLKDSWWLYNEIYKTKDGYELHVLLVNKEGKLINFIISFTEVEFY